MVLGRMRRRCRTALSGFTVVDLLRRAGVEAVCVAVDNADSVAGSHGITVKMDAGIDAVDFDSFDILVCPRAVPYVQKCWAPHR